MEFTDGLLPDSQRLPSWKRNMELQSESLTMFRKAIPSSWLVHDHRAEDIGCDLMVEVVSDEHPRGLIFAVQLKGTDQPLRKSGGGSVRIDVATLNRLRKLPCPAMVLQYHAREERSYFTWVDKLAPLPATHTTTLHLARLLWEYEIDLLVLDLVSFYRTPVAPLGLLQLLGYASLFPLNREEALTRIPEHTLPHVLTFLREADWNVLLSREEFTPSQIPFISSLASLNDECREAVMALIPRFLVAAFDHCREDEVWYAIEALRHDGFQLGPREFTPLWGSWLESKDIERIPLVLDTIVDCPDGSEVRRQVVAVLRQRFGKDWENISPKAIEDGETGAFGEWLLEIGEKAGTVVLDFIQLDNEIDEALRQDLESAWEAIRDETEYKSRQ